MHNFTGLASASLLSGAAEDSAGFLAIFSRDLLETSTGFACSLFQGTPVGLPSPVLTPSYPSTPCSVLPGRTETDSSAKLVILCVHTPAQVSENLGINHLFVHTLWTQKAALRTTSAFVSSLSPGLSALFLSFFNLLITSLYTVSPGLITKATFKERIVI